MRASTVLFLIIVALLLFRERDPFEPEPEDEGEELPMFI